MAFPNQLFSQDVHSAASENKAEPKAFSHESFLIACENSTDFPITATHDFINKLDYGQLENLLLLHLDYLDGIKSAIVLDKNLYPTGVGMVRDATNALPPEKRLDPDDSILLKENLLLRTLGVVRGIDQALHFQSEMQKNPGLGAARSKLQEIYRQFVMTIIEKNPENLKTAQEELNTQLVELLHETNLDAELDSSKEYQKLLSHYRDLAATLDPAKSLVTIVKHNKGGFEIIQTETAHPITVKTVTQKFQLDVMKKIHPEKSKTHTDFHSAKKAAFQLATRRFVN